MSDIVVGIRLKADGSGLVGQMTSAKGKVTEFGNATHNVSKQANTASKNIDQMGNATEQLKRKVVGLGALLASGFAVRDLTRFADEATNIKNKINDVTDSAEKQAAMQQTLLATANATRSGLSATTDLYATLSRNARELVKTDQDLVDITATITKSFALSGATTAEADGAIRQLSQGLAAGALRGDEFNSVAEGAPEIMRAIAKETGKTTGELREFAATGGITAEIVVNALQGAAQGIDARFSKMTASLSSSMTVVQNNLIDYIGTQNEALGVTESLGAGLVNLSENLDTVQDVLVLSATVMAGRYVGAIVAATAAKAALVRQELLSTAAMTTGRAGLGRKVVALNASTIATNALTISTRGLNAAMGFLGGPVGLAITAAAALVYFGSESNTAKEKTAELTTEIDKLVSKYISLNDVGRKIELSKLTEKEEIARSKILALQEKIAEQEQKSKNRGPSTNQFSGIGDAVGIAKLQAEIGELDKTLTEISQKKKALFDSTFNVDDIKTQVAANNAAFKAANDEQLSSAIAAYQNQTEAFDRELQLREAVVKGQLTKEEAAIYSSLYRQQDANTRQYEQLEQKISDFYAKEIEKAGTNKDAIIALEQEKANKLAEIKQISRDQDQLLQQDFAAELNVSVNAEDPELDSLRESLLSQEDLIGQHLQQKHALLANAYAQGKLQEDEFISLSLAANQQYHNELDAYNNARANMMLSSGQQIFGGMADLAKSFGGEQSKAYKAMFAVQKGFAIAQGVLNLSTAISNASAAQPWYMAIPAMANAAAQGAQLVSTIKGASYAGQAHDGLRRVDNEGTYVVRKDEMVLNPKQRENFEQVVDATTGNGRVAANSPVYHFSPQISIDATNATPGMEDKIRQQVDMSLKEFDAELQRDFATNGRRSRMLRAG
ncbi:tape measure protein [uncultured Paraglaciecola sp.]|uniref:tape measure protein n=1 Tax=uncultured Paraglaciecola sp. TaxID=1765024 RepID=UPI00262E8837|nr:tape measure protein [uncultured Paraglaciecola sp.]